MTFMILKTLQLWSCPVKKRYQASAKSINTSQPVQSVQVELCQNFLPMVNWWSEKLDIYRFTIL